MSEQPKALTALKNSQANILGAVFQVESQIDPFRKARMVQVFIEPNPVSGEVYEQGRGKYALTQVGLAKLASAGNMVFRVIDQHTTSDYVRITVEGSYTNASGETLTDQKTSEIYLDDVEEEIMERPPNQWEKNDPPEALRAKRVKEFRQFRKFKLQRCETSAKNRVIRSLLAIRNVYTPEELAKPFVLATVTYSPDFSDREVKNAAIQKFLGNSNALFGEKTEAALPEYSAPMALPVHHENSEFYDEAGNRDSSALPPLTPPEKPTKELFDVSGLPEVADLPKETPCPKCGGQTQYRQGIAKTGKPYACYSCLDPDCDGVQFSKYREGYADHVPTPPREQPPIQAQEEYDPY